MLFFLVYYLTFNNSQPVDLNFDPSPFVLILVNGEHFEVKPKVPPLNKIYVTALLDEGINLEVLKIILIRGKIIDASEENLRCIHVSTRYEVPGFTYDTEKEGIFPLHDFVNLLDKVDGKNFFEALYEEEENFLIIRYNPPVPAAKRPALDPASTGILSGK